MRWEKGRRDGNIEDRRGMGGTVAGGGIGVAVIALIAYYVFGVDPQTAQQVASQIGGTTSSSQGEAEFGTPEDRAGQFVDVVGTNVNDVWEQYFDGYRKPEIVLYSQGTQTACGAGQAAMGPFYCPGDSTVYLDLSFWEEMETRLGASGADFARAYVIAHEIGHHVQSLTGAMQKVRQAQQGARTEAESNGYLVSLELQADCYAGVWAAHASAVSGGAVALEPGDMEEGLKTAQAIGDDTLQRNAGRRVSPEAFTHGSSEQRMKWLKHGYETGDPNACDTFGG